MTLLDDIGNKIVEKHEKNVDKAFSLMKYFLAVVTVYISIISFYLQGLGKHTFELNGSVVVFILSLFIAFAVLICAMLPKNTFIFRLKDKEYKILEGEALKSLLDELYLAVQKQDSYFVIIHLLIFGSTMAFMNLFFNNKYFLAFIVLYCFVAVVLYLLVLFRLKKK